MAIFVIRHGETVWNAARIVQLPTTPLSPRGMAQAERVAERLARAGVARIVTSDLARAAMTAEAVRVRTGAPVEVEPALAERDFGDLRGTPYADLSMDPFAADYVPPGGESWPTFHVRVARAWESVVRVATATRGNVVVVTHGLVCRVLAERHLQVPGSQSLPPRWENAALTEIDGAPPWTARVINCTAHLTIPPALVESALDEAGGDADEALEAEGP